MNNYKKDYKIIEICIGLILIFLAIFFLIMPAEGKVNPNSTMVISYTTPNSITWNYNYTVNLISASLDGVSIINFDKYSYNFTANDLSENSQHTFCIYSVTEVNCETGKTSYSGETNLQELAWQFIFIILAIIFIIVGLYVPYIGYGGFIFSALGIMQTINNIAIDKITFSSFIMATIYVILICASIITSFKEE
jgi:hypothetical protein